jgi:hypothetical protein
MTEKKVGTDTTFYTPKPMRPAMAGLLLNLGGGIHSEWKLNKIKNYVRLEIIINRDCFASLAMTQEKWLAMTHERRITIT